MGELILYTTEDGRSQIQLRAKDETVWRSQREIAQLPAISTDKVGLHPKDNYEDEHRLPEDVIRRRFAAGLRNFEAAYKPAVNAWAAYDNEGRSPVLLDWGENP